MCRMIAVDILLVSASSLHEKMPFVVIVCFILIASSCACDHPRIQSQGSIPNSILEALRCQIDLLIAAGNMMVSLLFLGPHYPEEAPSFVRLY